MNKNKKNKEKKALVVTTVASTLDQFCMNDIAILQKSHEVSVGANFEIGSNTSKQRINEFKKELELSEVGIKHIEINRNPFNIVNFKAYHELKKIINEDSFDIIHCHTPVAAMLVRLAARKERRRGTRVVYTAHGFHFYKGSPLINWLLYYPLEWFLARYTDLLITINAEDFKRAKKNFKARSIRYIPGVGIDIKKFNQNNVDNVNKRKEIGLIDNSFVVLSVGELNKNKNHETVIRAIAQLKNSDIYYVICGQGQLKPHLELLIKNLKMEKQVKLLGFRKDISEICNISDVFVFPSFREGLSVSLMEAMASGLPVVCSDIRGNSDLIKDNQGGYLIKPTDINGFSASINKLFEDKARRKSFGDFNMNSVREYRLENVISNMEEFYSEVTC